MFTATPALQHQGPPRAGDRPQGVRVHLREDAIPRATFAFPEEASSATLHLLSSLISLFIEMLVMTFQIDFEIH